MKLRLIEGWQWWYKFWSVRLGAVGAALTTFLIAYPDFATTVWLNLPSEIKATIPPQYMPLIGVVISICGIIAKFVVQRKLKEKIADATSKSD